MILYQDEHFAICQHEKNRDVMIIQKIDKRRVKMIFHSLIDPGAPMMTKEEAKNFLFDYIGYNKG